MEEAVQVLRIVGQQKQKKMFNDYQAEGVPESLLQSIHAPVGIAIHSQTAGRDCGKSIAAEIIQVRKWLISPLTV